MGINSYTAAGMFEYNKKHRNGRNEVRFVAINPYFFNFFKRTTAVAETARPMPGVTIEWTPEHKQPTVTVDDMNINQEAQLFCQMYGDQMVEMVS